MGNSIDDKLHGILTLHSETGTEGGYWAFQDNTYIHQHVPKGYCSKCGIVMQKQNGPIAVQRVYEVDEDLLDDIRVGNSLKQRPVCSKDEHVETVGDVWDYEGLHLLDNGDELQIYDYTTKTQVWSGIINLEKYPPFTRSVGGLWVHSNQIGVDMGVWSHYFFESYPATLMLNKNK